MEQITDYLCRYKNYNFAIGFTTAEHIDSLQSFELRDSDIILVTYPKSGQWDKLFCITSFAFTVLSISGNRFTDQVGRLLTWHMLPHRHCVDSTDHHLHLWVGRRSEWISKQLGADAVAGVQGGSRWLLPSTLSTTLCLSPHPGSHTSRTEGQEGKGQYFMEAQSCQIKINVKNILRKIWIINRNVHIYIHTHILWYVTIRRVLNG